MPDGFFYRFIKSRNVSSMRYKRQLAAKICAHPLKYVTQSDPEYGDKVIGRDGQCRVNDGDEFIVSCESGVLFRAALKDVRLFELMSLDGAVVSGNDDTEGGDFREITVHYKYYK